MRSDILFLGDLNVLKVLPLAAMVGLFDLRKCFREALYGECPEKEPHGEAMAELGCDTMHLQQKYVQGLNESMGVPRDFFFHGDHVLCMAQGLHSNPGKKKWEVFYSGMPLLRFVENPATESVEIVKKEYGSSVWMQFDPSDSFD